MKRIKEIIKNVIKLLLKLVPTDKKLWVFGAWAGKLYADNSKYMFEYVNNNKPQIKAVWVTKSDDVLKQVRAMGYRCYKSYSVLGIWYVSRAAVCFETAGNGDISVLAECSKAKIIQLWHGMGIKDVGISDKGWYGSYSEEKKAQLEKSFKDNHATWYWMAASQEAVTKYHKAYYVPEEHFFITGQPKDDTFVNVNENEYINDIRKKHPAARIAVYLPTHRNFGADNEISDVMSIESLEKLNKKLCEKNIVMIFKPHFHEFSKYAGCESAMSNIVFATDMQKFGDVYEFLPQCDMLITDYSGIMFGYIASSKPIIYFAYDYDEYINSDAGFCYDYNDITYGPVCSTWDDVVDAAATIESADYDELRQKQRERFCPHCDGRSCERIFEQTMKLIG